MECIKNSGIYIFWKLTQQLFIIQWGVWWFGYEADWEMQDVPNEAEHRKTLVLSLLDC
jgi:hypothetical protein